MPMTSGPSDNSQLIYIPCDCGKRLVANAMQSGKRFKCPSCGLVVVVPPMVAGIDPTLPLAAAKPNVEAENRRFWNVLSMTSIGLFLFGAVICGGAWVYRGLNPMDGQRGDQRVAGADASEKVGADAALTQAETQRAEKAADYLFRSAISKLDSKAIGDAITLLQQYLANPHAAKKPEAEQLLADCEMAISESTAINTLIAMSDEQFEQYKSTGNVNDHKFAHPILEVIQSFTFRRVLATANQRRAENKIADAKRQEIANAAKNDPAKPEDATQGRSVSERMIGIWRWGPGENEMRFTSDGTFVERGSWGVISQGRWNLDEDGYNWVHGFVRLLYDNKIEGRIAISRKEDKLHIDLLIPPSADMRPGSPRVSMHLVGTRIQGNPSWWNPQSAETISEKIVGIWRWDPSENEVMFAQDETFMERNSWGVVSRGRWEIDKARYDLRLMPSLNTADGLLDVGRKLVIVALVKDVFHFRIFDSLGMVAVNMDENKLVNQAGPIEELRKQLRTLWPPHELTQNDKDRIIAAVRSIVGQNDEEDKDLTVRMAYDNKRSAVVRVNLNADKVYIEPTTRLGYHSERVEGSKSQGNPTWWTDQTEAIRSKLIDEWRWGEEFDYSVKFDQDGTFVHRRDSDILFRGRWSIEKDGTISLTALDKPSNNGHSDLPAVRLNLNIDQIRLVKNLEDPESYSYIEANRYREKLITEAEVHGVWVHSPGGFTVLNREITLLPNGKIDDLDGQNSWTLDGKTLVLRWADPRAPGGSWVDTCTLVWRHKARLWQYSGVNQRKLGISGYRGNLPPGFEKMRQGAPAEGWEAANVVPGIFWSEQWRQVARATIAQRNAKAVAAAVAAAERRAWREWEELHWEELHPSTPWPKGPPVPWKGPTAAEETRRQEEDRFRNSGGRMGTSPGFR